ncbi:hypothetical protein BSK49_24455 [Paenibacillus odorifer]|uniref:hypothetical protein n=1 Tax=Paenibacillus odorifer TaxID=189426 RepID=UPI00096C5E30|nr:hypothetical protein [Paenibacillus odorifer]OMD83440.1 hypothetical protein BSK49_24455 [Paenibacillus odorifer]
MLVMDKIKQLCNMLPHEVYLEVSGAVFFTLQCLGCSNGTLGAGALFYLATIGDDDKLLDSIVQHIRRYGGSQESLLFAHVVTELSAQMQLSLRQSIELSDMVEDIIRKMNH